MELKTDGAILQFCANAFQDDMDATRQIYQRTWFRNILYYLGEHWFEWFESQATFRYKYLLDPNTPTPVFNMIRDNVRSTKALILNKKYVATVWPNSNEESDKNAAKLGRSIIEWLDALNGNDIEDVKEEVAMWMVLTGNGFARAFPDRDTGKYVVGKDGKVIDGPVDVGSEALTPFNVVVPYIGRKLEHKKWVGIRTLREKEWIEDTYHILLSDGTSNPQLIEYEKQLLTLVGNVSPWKGRGITSAGSLALDTTDLDLLQEIEMRPTKEHPNGRYIVVAGGKVLKNEENMPVPTDRKTGDWNYSITHFPYNATPGSFWASGSVDDQISPQNNINEIDQALAINRKTIGRPWVLTPSNVILKRISAKGVGVLNLTYDARTSMGARPVIEPGIPYPQQILEERANHRQAAQDTSGDPKNVLRGGTPHAGASGVLVDILRESAEQSHAPDISRFYRNWTKFNKKRIIVAQHVIRETRTLKIVGAGNKVEVRTFKGADLCNNTDVRYELDSGLSSTNAGKNELLLRMAQYGIFGDIAQEPDLRREVLKRFGLSGIPEKQNLQQERAERENLRLATGNIKNIALPNLPMQDPVTGQPINDDKGKPIMLFPPSFDPLFIHDDHAVHILTHEQTIFGAAFEDWPNDRKMMAIAHRDLHIAALQKTMQENVQAATPASMTQPQQKPPQPGDVGKAFADRLTGGAKQ